MSTPLRVIIIAGTTASGKTALGIQVAKRLGGAVISADSRMVYRRLDIGTGKPTWEHRTLDCSPWILPVSSGVGAFGIFHPDRDGIFQIRTPANKYCEFEVKLGPVYSIDGVDHYGLDLVEPEAKFTLTDWLGFARPLIARLQTQNIQPIVVGGTGLYLRALVLGFEPPSTDPVLRTAIEARSDEALLDTLSEFDPVTAQRVAGNRRRLVRAVEVIELTGRPFSQGLAPHALEAVVLAPQVDRTELYARIDARLRDRFGAGLIDEVRGLLAAGVSGDWLQSLGLEYRFITDWLTRFPPNQFHLSGGNRKVEDLEARLAAAIHHYARRQLTYLRHQLPVHWVRSTDEALALIHG